MHRKKQIGLTDTEITGIYNTIFSRFVGGVMTGKSFRINLVRKQIRYAGNIELFYLHRNRFVSQAPYPLLKISPEDRYAAEHGYVRFDMMGAGAPSDGGYGVRDFKAKFGGQLVEHGRFKYILNKPLYKLGTIGVQLIRKL